MHRREHRSQGSRGHHVGTPALEWQRTQASLRNLPVQTAAGPKQRARVPHASRRNRRQKDIHLETVQWGGDHNLHARQLSEAHEKNIMAQFQTYTRRAADARNIRDDLSLTFKELYRQEQVRVGTSGPINIYATPSAILFIRGCADLRTCRNLCFNRLLHTVGKSIDYCYHLAEICNRFPTYQCKVRALSNIRNYLESHHQKLGARYTLKVTSTYHAPSIKAWAKRTVVQSGGLRPNWTRYTLARLQTISMPMNTWNLKLVNIQRTMRNHRWDLNSMLTSLASGPEQGEELADLVRIPANSKSRFDLEEQYASSTQRSHCYSFLGSIGVNHDLVHIPESFKEAPPVEPYTLPSSQEPFVNHHPEALAADLYRCTTDPTNVYTVEDKDPSILWQLKGTRIYDFWYRLMANSPKRWEIQSISSDAILKNYRTILDTILPKSLIGKAGNAFSLAHVPYAYFTIKYKCFKHAAQQCCDHFTPGEHTKKTDPDSFKPHPAHTCVKPGHSCLRNIISFKKLPGRAAFKRVGRAFSFALQAVMPGYGIRDLSRGRDILEEGLEKTVEA